MLQRYRKLYISYKIYEDIYADFTGDFGKSIDTPNYEVERP